MRIIQPSARNILHCSVRGLHGTDTALHSSQWIEFGRYFCEYVVYASAAGNCMVASLSDIKITQRFGLCMINLQTVGYSLRSVIGTTGAASTLKHTDRKSVV